MDIVFIAIFILPLIFGLATIIAAIVYAEMSNAVDNRRIREYCNDANSPRFVVRNDVVVRSKTVFCT